MYSYSLIKPSTLLIVLALIFNSCSKSNTIGLEGGNIELEDDKIDEPQPPINYTYEFTKNQYTHAYNDNNTVIPYNFFEPAQAMTSDDNFPLIVSLHGTEYHLISNEDFLAYFPSNYMATAWIEEVKQQEFPAYVVAPNLYDEIYDINGYRSWKDLASQDFLNELIDALISTYQIDRNRIYFVGHSIGGGAVWELSQTLKNKAAAIVPLSHALGATENANPIIDDISNGIYDDISIWAIVHVSDNEGSTRTGRPIFTYLQDNNYEPVITNTLGTQVYELTPDQIEAEIDLGKRYFYTENRGRPCEHGGGCHYSWVSQLEGNLIYKWLFQQRKND